MARMSGIRSASKHEQHEQNACKREKQKRCVRRRLIARDVRHEPDEVRRLGPRLRYAGGRDGDHSSRELAANALVEGYQCGQQ